MTIIYEDNHIIAVNKTCSEIVQGDKTGDTPLSDMVKAYIKEKYNKPGDVFLGVPHRLDRPTSGVVLFARTSKALSRLTAMFRNHGEIRKTYWAIVKRTADMPSASSEEVVTLDNYIYRNEQQNKSYIVAPTHKDAKRAILTYRIIDCSDRYQLVEIELQTGRHHQIRCQLAHVGMPIKGDLKYGYERSNHDGGICLHAKSIEFVHPVSRIPLKIVAPLPTTDIWNLFKNSQQS